ncbi:MAG TPA: competence type IV pilus minor pilin ComGF [Staphylococcus sp.]|nr:competence type IV pilus minor pilin ComGF [Staphylococcus sp.]
MKFAILKKINAFTYIEVLFAFLITTLILIIIPPLIKSTFTFNFLNSNDMVVEVEFFARDLTQDLLEKNTKVNVNKYNLSHLEIKNEQNTISYKLNNNKIIKYINGKGNITILNNVKTIEYNIIKRNSILIKLKLIDGRQTFEKQIYI